MVFINSKKLIVSRSIGFIKRFFCKLLLKIQHAHFRARAESTSVKKSEVFIAPTFSYNTNADSKVAPTPGSQKHCFHLLSKHFYWYIFSLSLR